jgi:hypothetical protein
MVFPVVVFFEFLFPCFFASLLFAFDAVLPLPASLLLHCAASLLFAFLLLFLSLLLCFFASLLLHCSASLLFSAFLLLKPN